MPPQTPAVSAPKQTVTEVDLEAVIALPAEEEKTATPQQEPPYETAHEPEPVLMEVLAVPEVQPTPETERALDPAPVQAITNPQPGDMVYVSGFGWLKCQGPGEATYAEDMYENGNKIGIMG